MKIRIGGDYLSIIGVRLGVQPESIWLARGLARKFADGVSRGVTYGGKQFCPTICHTPSVGGRTEVLLGWIDEGNDRK